VRRLLAELGFRSMDEIIGRNDLLERVERPDVPRAQMLDLSMLMDRRTGGQADGQGVALRRMVERNDRPGLISLDKEILSELEPYLDCSLPFSGNYQILNHHLAVGARVAGAIAERNGDTGLPPGSVRLRFRGTAGQSFGAFLCRGVHLELEGEANDYVGKGLSGGEITIRPFRQVSYGHASHQHLIIGNTVLYGATGGKLFAAGQAGDRFAVRNSGAVAVIEGAGNHCCEYMTGGIVVVLGRAGRNFGAGMSNGLAYVLDEAGTFAGRLNGDMVELSELDAEDVDLLRKLIHEHEEKTVSTRARNLLVRWEEYRPLFKKVVPRGAGALVEVIRARYLDSAQMEPELSLERRTA
jgi:glutamate synthase domain-containing protein 3